MYHSVIAQHDRPILPAPTPSFRHAALTAGFDDFTQIEDDLDTVMEVVCQVAAWGVGARFVGVLQYHLNEQAFVLQAGIGWPVRLIGRCRVSADLCTTAGVAWLTGELVHFQDLDKVGRIRIPDAMAGQGIHQVVSVPIVGEVEGEGFGVLEVGSTDSGCFARHDLLFLRGLANAAAAVVDRHTRLARMATLAAKVRALDSNAAACGIFASSAAVSYQQDVQTGLGHRPSFP